jgi:hypothetical protein
MIGKLHDCSDQAKFRLQYPGHGVTQFSHIACSRNPFKTSLQSLLQPGIFLGLVNQGGEPASFNAKLVSQHTDLALEQRHCPAACRVRNDKLTQQRQMALKKVRAGAQVAGHFILAQTRWGSIVILAIGVF